MKLNLKKGLDLKLAGGIDANSTPVADIVAERYAVTPDDFTGLKPKAEVREGDTVKAGDPLLHHKDYESVKVLSPVSGVVEAVVRGERRKIERIVVRKEGDEHCIGLPSIANIQDATQAVDFLCRTGMMARMRQRPYDVVPNPAVLPRDIFVTAIDSAPLAAPLAVQLGNDAPKCLESAVKLMCKVTTGDVYISTGESWNFGDVPGAVMVEVKGKHPVGNVGVQIANIKPVNKGEVVWTLDVVTLYKIGRALEQGFVDFSTVVAVTGSEVSSPCLVKAIEGSEVAPILDGRLLTADHHIRIISGNVLTGTVVGADGYLRAPYRQITVIPEGDDVAEFMGWASLSPKKMSVSRSFPGHFLFGKLFKPDARLLGGQRAMIMSGEYDKVLPMDIMAEYLLKAIVSRDIDAMEQLGIYEVAPEDFALCEYVDTSKQPIQQMVRDGLDFMRSQVG